MVRWLCTLLGHCRTHETITKGGSKYLENGNYNFRYYNASRNLFTSLINFLCLLLVWFLFLLSCSWWIPFPLITDKVGEFNIEKFHEISIKQIFIGLEWYWYSTIFSSVIQKLMWVIHYFKGCPKGTVKEIFGHHLVLLCPLSPRWDKTSKKEHSKWVPLEWIKWHAFMYFLYYLVF